MSKHVEYLSAMEWSMGNGQCPECCGMPESWHGHPCAMTPDCIGHELDCPLAAALLSAGCDPLMKGDFSSDVVYERFVSEDGFYGTRPVGEVTP
jgi:hypothetical protein